MKFKKEILEVMISLILAIIIVCTSIPWYAIAKSPAEINNDKIETTGANETEEINNKAELTNNNKMESTNDNKVEENNKAKTDESTIVGDSKAINDEQLSSQVASKSNTEKIAKATTSSSEELISAISEQNEEEINPKNTTTDEEFKIALRWGGTSNQTYSWNANKSENRVIKLTFYYQNEVTKRAYAPGELVVTIPGIGKLNREGTIKASDIAADVYGSKELKRDWSYKYNQATDTYTFYNNHQIEQGETFNGSFEMLWEFTSRNCINEYEQKLKATLTAGEQTIETQELGIEYTSKRDTFYINKTAKSITSADGLKKYVAPEKAVADYAWVQYTFRYNVQETNARALKSRYFIDTLPVGCVIAKDTNVIKNEDGTVSYKIEESSVPENSVREYGVIVGYPEEYIGKTIDNTAYLYGTYKDETEDVQLAESTVQIKLERIQNQAVGIVPGKYMSPDYVYKEALVGDISFSASLYATATTNEEDEGYTVAVTDDLLEIYTPANTESGKEATYHTLQDNEYKFTSVTIPGKNSFTNANGYTLSDGDFTIKIYALYKKDVTEDITTRGLANYTKVYEGKWENNSITQDLTKIANTEGDTETKDEGNNVLAIRAEVSGLTESVKSFYISTRGTINVSENVASSIYENPSYIINYDFTELKDKNGNSLIPNIEKENYSQERIYERDSLIYGKGLLRANDTIRIIEKIETPPTPGYYYAHSDIEKFSVDENVEYFVTKLHHSSTVNNKDSKEINKIEIHGVTEKAELETLIETLTLTQSGLLFKNSLSSDTDIQEYIKERANITKDGKEISITFDFSDNPITSKNFTIGYNVDARLNYEEYYNSSNPSYTITTYAYLEDSGLQAQSTGSHNEKTMATHRDSESILLALSSHQQLIKMVKTMYSGEFVQENAVTPMNTEYTYRLKLRNGYNTLINTEFVDILEHAELTNVDGEYPYKESEWYGTFKNINTTYLEGQGLKTKAYYANTLTPDQNSWTLMENYSDGIWSVAEGKETEVKAVKVEIEGEIVENSIVYVDINMQSPNDKTLVDKKAYNTYQINCDAIDLYTGMQSTYMKNMPSNATDVRLVEKEYNVIITKTDKTTGRKLMGVQFGIYDSEGNKIRTNITGILGNTMVKGLKEGTYTIKEEIAPLGYEKIQDYTLIIENGNYIVKCGEEIKSEGESTLINNTPTINFNIENQRAKGSITIHKIDEYLNSSKKEQPLSGAKFDLIDPTLEAENQVVATGTTDSKGNIVFENLEWGKTYKIQEKESLKGYELAEENTYLSNLNKDKTVTIQNIRKTGTVTLTKQDERDGTKLEGAKYGLYAKNTIYDKEGNAIYEPDELIKEGTTNEQGQITFKDLIWGDYYIQEKETIYGYELSETKHEFTISAQTVENIIEKTEKEKRSKANLQLVKIDEKGNFLPGVEFGLYDETGKAVINKKEKTDENEITFTQTGTHNWTKQGDRTWQSDNYHVNNSNATIESNEFTLEYNGKITFEWSVSSQGTTSDYAYYTIKNIETEEEIGGESTKIGGTSNGTSYSSLKFNLVQEKLQAGKYKIIYTYVKDGSTNSGLDRAYVRNINATYEIPCITNEQGQLNIEGIEWGNYYIQEIKTPEGYERSNTKFNFTVNRETFANGNKTVTVVTNEETNEETSVIRNNRKKGQVTLTKYACDAEGNETTNILQNAIYELYSADGTVIGEYKTNEEGKITVENLEWDSYYFLEKEAPEGYSISDKKIAFVINSQNAEFKQELVAYDKQESGEIKINKTIKAESIYKAHGNSTFIFKIIGKDENNEEKVTLYRTITFTEEDKKDIDEQGNITKTITISNIEPYKYEITEEENYRYELSKIIPITNAQVDESNENIGIINLLEAEQNKGEITFENTKTSNSLLTDTGLITNTAQNEYYLIGIGATPKQENYETGTNLTAESFKYKLYYSGGQEIEAELVDGITINGKTTYTEAIPGSYITNIEYTANGKIYETQTVTKWTMPSDYFTYTVINATKKTIAITGISTKYTSPEVLYIPSEYNGYKVQRVGINTSDSDGYRDSDRKLSNISNVKSVEIAEGVEEIGACAFYQYSKIETINLPTTLTSIGNYAFSYCSNLTSINILEGVTSIGNYAFYYCSNLTSINILEGATSIGNYAFSHCSNLTSINILEGVTSIGNYAFYYCSNLTSINILEGVTSIGNYAFSYCSNLTSINIPEGVTSIGEYAFESCRSLTSINIPEGVTRIGNRAFSNCRSLTSIELPSSLTSMGYGAFEGCSGLTSINIQEGVTSIGDGAFNWCSNLTSIELPSSLTSIGETALYGCNGLTSINIPEGVTSIGNNAFGYCRGLASIDLPSSVTSIGRSAFQYCIGLTSIELPSSLTSIGNLAFYGCSGLTSINVAEDNENYSSVDGVVYNKDKTELIIYPEGKTPYIIPEGVTSIRNNAFYGFSGLTSIEIPSSVTSIGAGAFNGCSRLTSINVVEDNESYSSVDGVLYNKDKTELIKYPNGKKDLKEYVIPEGVTSIGDNTFSGCSGLTSINIPEGVTSIGEFAFDGCSGLTSIELPSSVTSIGRYAFRYCEGLASVNIPEGVTSIENYTFVGCNVLRSIDLPSSVTSIGDSVFTDCYNFKTINYHGTPEQFSAITIGSDNSYFKRATVNYITE